MRSIINLVEGVTDDFLFHGTHLSAAASILAQDTLRMSQDYPNTPLAVSTSRSYQLAHDFGTYWDRQFPVVFVLDRRKLQQTYPVQPFRDHDPEGAPRGREFEEMVPRTIHPLRRVLVSVNVDLKDIRLALRDQNYLQYTVDEQGDDFRSKAALARAIKALAASPFLNKWAPRGFAS